MYIYIFLNINILEIFVYYITEILKQGALINKKFNVAIITFLTHI